MGKKSALVVVDVQRGLIDGFEHDWIEVLPAIGELIESARGASVPVVLVQHCGLEPGHPLWADSPGWALHPIVDPRADDLLVTKRWSDAFEGTDLHEVLEGAGVERIALVGAQSEFCIDTTVRRAASLGYDVDLVSNGHTTSENGLLTREQIVAHTNQTLASLAVVGVTIRVLAAAEVEFG